MIYLILVIVKVWCFSFDISDPEKSICFKLYTIKDEDFYINYLVSGSKDYNIRVILFNPNEAITFTSLPRTREGARSFKSTMEGYYKLCFYSKDSTKKKVTFELGKHRNLVHNIENKEHVEGLCKTFDILGDSLELVNKNIEYRDIRGKVHFELSERIENLVLYGATCKMFSLIIVFLFQLLSMYRVFTDIKISV